jgi:ABC-2 type transport system permease protein
VAFAVIALVLSLALSLGADAMGSVATNAEAAGQTLLIPPTAAGDDLDGHHPGRGVSRLARPVRAQPARLAVSEALRGLAAGHVLRDNLLISLTWCLGLLLAFGAIAVRNATADEMTTTLALQSRLQAGRLLRGWTREPVVLIQSLIFPTFLLVVYNLVIGASVRNLTGGDSLYGLVPMCAVAGALFGAIGTGAAIPDERESGLLSRLLFFDTGMVPVGVFPGWLQPFRQGPTDVAGHRGDAGPCRRRSDAVARPAVGRVGGGPGRGVRPDGGARVSRRRGVRQLTARRDSTP